MIDEAKLREAGLLDLQERRVYRLHCRNLLVGVYNGKGFVGIRRKFDSRYLFEEYPVTLEGGPFQTVRRAEPLDVTVPDDMPLAEDLGTICCECETPATWTGPPSPAPWACESGCDDVHPVSVANRALFELLDPIDAEELERDRAQRAAEEAEYVARRASRE